MRNLPFTGLALALALDLLGAVLAAPADAQSGTPAGGAGAAASLPLGVAPEIGAAIAKGAEYLRRSQHREGAWGAGAHHQACAAAVAVQLPHALVPTYQRWVATKDERLPAMMGHQK